MPTSLRSVLLRTTLAGAVFGLAAVSAAAANATTGTATPDPAETRSVVAPKPVTALQLRSTRRGR